MICIVALVIFGILGIFSATHRQTAKEAFDCVFKTITLRPCNTGFDQRMKGKVVGFLFKTNPKLAGVISKNFKVFSILLIVLMFVSFIYSGIAVYNLTMHGTCNPLEPDSCILTPTQVEAGCTCDSDGTPCEHTIDPTADCLADCGCEGGKECS